MAAASAGAGGQLYTPVRLPLSNEAHLQAMVVGLEATNAIQPSSLCAGPMLPLAAMLAIFRAMPDSPSVVPKDKV